MVSTSKILTVSYGTFSCTLEGFDESFDTMKAIAEYFRDLAADDRYFGAEPPTPDAEMLARIAEKEISRRVEAHDENGRIHLRADATAALPANGDTAPVAVDSSAVSPARDMAEPAVGEDAPVDTPVIEDAHQDLIAEDEMITEVAEPEIIDAPAAEAPAVSDDPESVADKLRRIRAVATPAGASLADQFFNEDEHAQDFLDTTVADLDAALAADDAVEELVEEIPVAQDVRDDIQEDVQDEAPAPEMEAEAPSEPEIPGPAEDEAQIADVTDDIMAALGEVEDDTAEDQQAPEMFETSEPDLEDEDILADLREDDNVQPGETGDTAALDAVAEALAADPAEEEIAEVSEPDEAPAAEEGDTLSQLMADALREEEEDDAAALKEQPIDTTSEDTDQDERPLNARVIKMKRRDFNDAVAQGKLEETGESSLSPEDEAELRRELAEVEAELAKTTNQDAVENAEIEDQIETPAPEAAEDDTPVSPKRANHLTDGADDHADRIFNEADTQLEEPEGNERRSAIQHLRAAVAATKAEKNAGGNIDPDVDDEPYRIDLKQAVRPRRPQAASTSARSERPTTGDRPAPLRLVAEQRIDQPGEPVRPRRVSRADLVSSAPVEVDSDGALSGSFSEYADEVGASSLTDLLEAAAAYLSDVEGRPQFSRPMLMQKLREIDEESFSREEGLRSFGQLLRQGKLQKLKGGRFAVTEETDFRKAG